MTLKLRICTLQTILRSNLNFDGTEFTMKVTAVIKLEQENLRFSCKFSFAIYLVEKREPTRISNKNEQTEKKKFLKELPKILIAKLYVCRKETPM